LLFFVPFQYPGILPTGCLSVCRYGRLKSEVVRDVIKKRTFWGKNDPLREDFENFVPKGFIVSKIHVFCANFVKFGRPCVISRTKKWARTLTLASARIAPKICQGQRQTI